MADKPDPKDPVIEEEVVEPAPPEVTPPEPEVPEAEVPEPEEVEEPEVPLEEPEEPPARSRRERLRIADVFEKGKQAAQAATPTPSGVLDYSTELDADPEIIKKLEADRQAAIKAAVAENQLQRQTDKWETFVNLDAPQVEAKYPQLDANSEDFHPVLADAIRQMYFQTSGLKVNSDNTYTVSNPGIRYKDYVESVFELANEIAGEKIETSTKNIKKQAAQTGIRPGSGTTKRLNLNQTPNAMSDEELNAKIEADFKALGLA